MADALLDPDQAGVYNQAIMDFGATVCTPRNPQCASCLQQPGCVAWQKGMTEQLPVKEKIIRKKQRYLYYFVVETPKEEVYIRQRRGKDIWEGLYEFILYETTDVFGRKRSCNPTLSGNCLMGRHSQSGISPGSIGRN